VIAIVVVFLFGVATTVYLSLRSPEVKVPDVVGKNRFDAEKVLEAADLKYRVRASRPTNQSQPDTVLFQLPRAGEVVKTGQTVAMDISRPAKAGESQETVKPEEPSENRNTNASTNANENKPKKPKPKNTNDNANGNTNTNANANRSTNANANRSTNTNRPANTNVNRSNTNTNANSGNVNAVPRPSNTNQRNTNSRPASTNANDNRRPVPRPTPSVPRPDR